MRIRSMRITDGCNRENVQEGMDLLNKRIKQQ